MRTTIALDDDLIFILKSLSQSKKRTLGQVISDLVRKALTSSSVQFRKDDFPVLKPQKNVPPATLDLVNSIRDNIALEYEN